MPLFSIITTSLNSEKTIEDTIKSVISQTCDDYEYFIIDSLSKDRTIDIVKKYSSRISKIISEKDNGIYDGMNRGLSSANGDFIIFLNSDDVFYNNKVLENIKNFINNYQDVDIFYGNIIYSSENNLNKILRVWMSKDLDKSDFRKSYCPPHPAFIAKLYLYKKYGLFDTSYKISSDYDLMFRFMYINNLKSKFINLTITKMRYGGISNSSLKNIFNQNMEIIDIHKKYKVKFNYLIFFLNKILSRMIQLINKPPVI